MTTAPQAAINQPETPQQHLALLLDSQRPRSLLCVSMNPVPLISHWCQDHDCELVTLAELDPLPQLNFERRFDLVVVADQLEYMAPTKGCELLGLLRNLYTENLIVLYQTQLAPQKLRWQEKDFIALGLKRDGVYQQGERGMTIYHYELAAYNYVRSWNNPRFWANPENWGKYWW